jgi:hypothetical protein
MNVYGIPNVSSPVTDAILGGLICDKLKSLGVRNVCVAEAAHGFDNNTFLDHSRYSENMPEEIRQNYVQSLLAYYLQAVKMDYNAMLYVHYHDGLVYFTTNAAR